MARLTKTKTSLGREIANSHDAISRVQTNVILRGEVEYGIYETVDDKVVVAHYDGMEFRYRVLYLSKRKGDPETGYAIHRHIGGVVGEWSELPKSKAEAAAAIASDARLQAIRIHAIRFELAKKVRAELDGESD